MHEHLRTFATQSRDALDGAARTWAESAQHLSRVPATPVPDLTAVVDMVFDLAEQVLATQRELTKALLRAVTP